MDLTFGQGLGLGVALPLHLHHLPAVHLDRLSVNDPCLTGLVVDHRGTLGPHPLWLGHGLQGLNLMGELGKNHRLAQVLLPRAPTCLAPLQHDPVVTGTPGLLGVELGQARLVGLVDDIGIMKGDLVGLRVPEGFGTSLVRGHVHPVAQHVVPAELPSGPVAQHPGTTTDPPPPVEGGRFTVLDVGPRCRRSRLLGQNPSHARPLYLRRQARRPCRRRPVQPRTSPRRTWPTGISRR